MNYYKLLQKLTAEDFKWLVRVLEIFNICEISDKLAVKAALLDLYYNTPWCLARQIKQPDNYFDNL